MNINPLYILPNFFTAGSIFFGIVSIMLASNASFEWAAWLIVVSMIFDGLDGRVARLTNTSSKFGIEFDSLADIVAFGVAPAMLVYYYIPTIGANYGFDGAYGLYRIFTCALFVIFGAIRLARFNITTINAEPNTFIGLPIPTAAVIIVLWILVDLRYNLFVSSFSYLLLVLTFIVSILMVSNIRYPSFKKIKWNLKIFTTLLIALALIISSKLYVEIFCAILSSYILYGIGRWVIMMCKVIVKKRA
ncbi:CDP-diacylglycerol--serine O-phosphatidyltransferase [Helicobacter fennelliae]|uniref:CDP-diacylglycerol--serine O-phosphatidyltransferase n=2 Tax=Helicobacter fennelliae TaxID=215 RepID=T1D1Q7_9HELI|nr:CDP-diacylglycerol--serine O-phosphatidyltransferase [Helicobacter fennelliae]GAD19171.1 CDP-diacylglycerol--serine O-phosphatidyltransferase [Helicobacter fennelliae MRY12-0050]SQB98963.1 phosphatidylserine synthase [Helicobacter fennelliae]STP08245.1 phosphatidylserine synthase [Helicobacter fennelliae]STQ84655.1 phosphatidylserine synthase [Helicobacter fennelliae]